MTGSAKYRSEVSVSAGATDIVSLDAPASAFTSFQIGLMRDGHGIRTVCMTIQTEVTMKRSSAHTKTQ
ncbi:hypothetical protein [Rhizobium sp. 768_B6_N1_8]|uniref:hypothetical protein n=1 Tax=unclassified Rhizobium TaxID=2613769 RepID=UPI003F250E15